MDDDNLSGYLSKKNINKVLIPHFKPCLKSKHGFFEINQEQKNTPSIGGGNKKKRLFVVKQYQKYWKNIKL